MTATNSDSATTQSVGGPRDTTPWPGIDRIVATSTAPGGSGIDSLLEHKLGPLSAAWYERSGQPVPARLHDEQRSASFAMLIAPALVRTIRDNAHGPLLLLKGPEVAALYPPGCRRFSDVDVLSPKAESVQAALLGAGFVEVDHEDYNLVEDHHHLHPLRFPAYWLNVEVHSNPNWPVRAAKPAPTEEIIEAAVPSILGIEGVSAPCRLHHTLLVATHAWRHEPLLRIRDLLDVAVLAQGLSGAQLEQTADRWGIGRLWRATWRATEALFYGKPEPATLRIWAAHLKTARERTIIENHLQHWLSPYWEMPPVQAFAQTLRTVRVDMSSAEDESSRVKLRRVASAIRHPFAPARRHPKSN